jgi:putative glutathione S-transferase
MGLLADERWQDRWCGTAARQGRFVRKDTAFRSWGTPDGRAGPSGSAGFAAEPAGRYHLHVSLACPWAHRTLIFRILKGLEQAIPVSVTHGFMGPAAPLGDEPLRSCRRQAYWEDRLS